MRPDRPSTSVGPPAAAGPSPSSPLWSDELAAYAGPLEAVSADLAAAARQLSELVHTGAVTGSCARGLTGIGDDLVGEVAGLARTLAVAAAALRLRGRR